MAQNIKKYQKKAEYSYTLGAFPTMELLQNRPELVRMVYLHSQMDSPELKEKLEELCKAKRIRLTVSDKTVEKLRDKENCFCIGLFDKQEGVLARDQDHIVLVNPSDMGNVGTILRTALGFGLHDIAIIEPAADVFNPKVIRSSMGALFHQRVQSFESFAEYEKAYGKGRLLYPFVLHGHHVLQELSVPRGERFALIFGNEATGLPKEFEAFEHSVTIRQSDEVDSFNLSMAAGMAIYEFTRFQS